MRYNFLEHANMAKMRDAHPDWIWNRSDTHVILGVPGTLDAWKSPVEPGNSFSPGPKSYGVSTWIRYNGKLFAPELMKADDLTWSFENGYLPLLNSRWMAEDLEITSSLFTDGDADVSDIYDYLTLKIANTGCETAEFQAYMVIRSFGAAGGEVRSLKREGNRLYVNGAPCICLCDGSGKFGAVSYQDTKKDIGCYLQNGEMPESQNINDPAGWASGCVEYELTLKPGESIELNFVYRLHAGHWMFNWREKLPESYDIESIRKAFLKKWEDRLKIRVDLPDKRFSDAFNCQLVHLLMFTVHNQPRISPISYPIWWLRDGAYVVNALNRGGFHDFAESAVCGVADKLAFGGFGSEGDAPGELLWILSEHYLLTRDRAFLEKVYPFMERQAEMLIKMRHTDKPLQVMTEYVIPQLMLEPNMDTPCLPAKDGLIIGRMDNHFPILWVNAFAYLGLKRMAVCTEALGRDHNRYADEAAELKAAIRAKSQEIFGQNDRDVNSAYWPAGWADKDDAFILGKFDEFWDTVRCPNGVFTPEPMWTYFEAGQAHNNILIGRRERAWKSIEWFLSHHTAQGLYTYHEADADENSSMQWQRTRGWDDIHYITPHGWTAAELFLLLRDCLVYEHDDELVVGAGIPISWLDKDFSYENMPTHFGVVSVKYSAKDAVLAVNGSGLKNVKVINAIPGETELRTGGFN